MRVLLTSVFAKEKSSTRNIVRLKTHISERELEDTLANGRRRGRAEKTVSIYLDFY